MILLYCNIFLVVKIESDDETSGVKDALESGTLGKKSIAYSEAYSI